MPCKAWGSISVHESSKPVLAQTHAASWQKAFVSHPAMWDSHNCQLTGSTSVSPLKWIQLKIMRWTQSHRKWAVKELRVKNPQKTLRKSACAHARTCCKTTPVQQSFREERYLFSTGSHCILRQLRPRHVDSIVSRAPLHNHTSTPLIDYKTVLNYVATKWFGNHSGTQFIEKPYL